MLRGTGKREKNTFSWYSNQEIHIGLQHPLPAINWIMDVRRAELIRLTHSNCSLLPPSALSLLCPSRPLPTLVHLRNPHTEDQPQTSLAPTQVQLPLPSGSSLFMGWVVYKNPFSGQGEYNQRNWILTQSLFMPWNLSTVRKPAFTGQSLSHLLSFCSILSFLSNLSLSWDSWGPTDPLITLLMQTFGIN